MPSADAGRLACVACGHLNPPGSRFCNRCGASLAAVAPAARPGPGSAAGFAASSDPLAGERKHATVLFADTAASMTVLVQQDAEEAARLFDQVLALMIEAVRRFEGTVHQTLGDGIMAVFGVPVAQEDHTARACYAALYMQERVSAFGEEVRRTQGIPVLIRVGLHAGEVVLRAPLEGLTEAISIVGPTVHLASRMEQLAKPGTILATAETVALAGAGVRARPVGPMLVKGVPEAMDVCEITGAVRVGDPSVLRPGAGARFVGRLAEMAQLERALRQAQTGPDGALVAIAGEPGIGKSRLAYEFMQRSAAEGCLAFLAAARPYTRATGHRVGMDVVRAYFGVDAGKPAAETRQRVTERLAAMEPQLEDHTPAIFWELGVLPSHSPFWKLDHAARRQRAYAAYLDLMRAEARRRPLVIVLENLQWMDSDAEQSVRQMAQRLPMGCLVLVTYRSDYDDHWLPASVLRLGLGPLSAEESAALLDALLGPAEGLAPLRRQLRAAAGGNPLFLEETVRDLAQTRALVGEPGEYRPGPGTAHVHPSRTVRSVVEARIDRLGPEEKRLLQCAAVIGEQVPRSVLEAVADRPGERVQALVSRLREAGFLDQRALFPEPCFAFRHTLIHDVTYGSLLHGPRRALHERVLRLLENARDAGGPVAMAELAHHAFQAEAWEPAVRYLRLAGQTGTDTGAREAAASYERALTALDHLRSRPDYRALAVDLRHDLCRALAPLGQHARILEILTAAEALTVELGDPRRLATTLSLLCAAHTELGHSAEAFATAERSVAVADQFGDPGLQILANHTLGAMARAAGDYPRAVACLRRSLEDEPATLSGAGGLPAPVAVLTRGQLAWSLAELGEFAQAVTYAEEGIRLAQAAGNVYGLAHAHLGLGGTLFRQGRLGEAMGVLERGLGLTRDVPFLAPPLAADLGVIYALSGRPDAARELGERAVAEGERMGRIGRLSLIVTHLGEIHLFGGRYDAARRDAERALSLARERGEHGNQVYALRLLGVVLGEATPPRAEEARGLLGEALALAERLGMRPLEARCHLSLGRLERRLGAMEAATHHLGQAVSLFRALDMQFWLARIMLDRLASPTGGQPDQVSGTGGS